MSLRKRLNIEPMFAFDLVFRFLRCQIDTSQIDGNVGITVGQIPGVKMQVGGKFWKFPCTGAPIWVPVKVICPVPTVSALDCAEKNNEDTIKTARYNILFIIILKIQGRIRSIK